jgi:tetratricopeptide (TPR) repeat protein
MKRQVARACLWICCVVASFLCASPSGAQTDPDFDRGIAEFRARNYESAAASFAQAERNAPGNTDALLYEAKSLVHLQNFTKAEDALHRYVTSHPESSDALYLLGFVLHRQNHPAESLATYTRAAAVAPPTGDDLKIVGLDYALLDDYGDAIKWLERAVERDPRNEDAWYYLGRAYYTKARLSEARKAFQTLLSLDPHSSKAENNLGLILETEGQPIAAMEAYRTAIAWQEQSNHPSEQPYANLGNLLMEQGQTKEAIAPLERAVALAPNNAFCHMTLGVAYRQLGRLDAAQRELETATQLEPSNAKAHYQLGRLYKNIHALDRAKAEFAKTADLNARSATPKTAPTNP